MPYTVTCFGWYMLGKLSDNLEQSSFRPFVDTPFILLSHGMLQLCPIRSFTEADNTVTFMVSFMPISDRIPSIQVKNKLYWSYQLECWAWRDDLPSAHFTELFPTLCASHAGLLFFELARLRPASEYESLLFLQPWNVLHTTGVYPHIVWVSA